MVRWIFPYAVLTLSFSLAAKASTVQSDRTPSFYTLAPITEIIPGNFGNVRVYYEEACNQEIVAVLTEAIDSRSFKAGVLTRVYASGCNLPSKTKFTVVRPHGAEIIPATFFDEAWHCQSNCTIFMNGRPQTFHYESFGTSSDQAMDEMYCSGVQSDLACRMIEIRADY